MIDHQPENTQIVGGSGNVFRDLGHADADVLQLKTILAAQIIAIPDARESCQAPWAGR